MSLTSMFRSWVAGSIVSSIACLPAQLSAEITPDKIVVSPDRESAVYEAGGKAVISIVCFDEQGNQIKSGVINVSIRHEYINPVTFEMDLSKSCELTVDGSRPGFVAIEAACGDIKSAAGVAFSPERIGDFKSEPIDFEDVWKNGQTSLTATPLDPIITKLPEFSTEEYTAYRVSFANIDDTRIYGFMTIPNGDGKYPIYFTVPGAGPRDTRPPIKHNEKVINMVMNVFPFELPTNYDDAEKLLAEHYNGEPYSYYSMFEGDKLEKAFFYRAFLGIDRAINYISTHPKYNGDGLIFWGSSQGGAMGVMLAAFNKNITAIAVNVPGDYSRTMEHPYLESGEHQERIKLVSYLTLRNFAKRVEIPLLVSAGLIDYGCTPSLIADFFNVVPSKDKRLYLVPGMGHSFDPTYDHMTAEFVDKHLGL